MSIVFNKVTYEWNSVADTSGLSADWIVDPVFINEERAQAVSPKYWTYNGNNITALYDNQILENSTFLNEFRQDMWTQIQIERDRRKGQGGYKVGNYWFHSDDTSRIQQIGLVILGANMPNNIMWKTMSGEFIQMTPTIALQIFQAAAASDIAIFSVAEQKKVAMMALTDPRTYDPLSGWPKAFGE